MCKIVNICINVSHLKLRINVMMSLKQISQCHLCLCIENISLKYCDDTLQLPFGLSHVIVGKLKLLKPLDAGGISYKKSTEFNLYDCISGN